MFERLDVIITKKGLTRSRSQARDLIRRGLVRVDGKIVRKPAQKVSISQQISILQNFGFVSRSAEKLLAALEEFKVELSDKTCLDVGSSTGGFTQVMLMFGAKKIYAVDVGTNQLHPALRQNPKIVLYENTDARTLNKDLIPEPIEFFTIDVSFISVSKILPHILPFLERKAQGIILIKPQFELTPQLVKKGVVRNKQLQQQAIEKVKTTAIALGFKPVGILPAPITGISGNQEFLLYVEFNKIS